MQKKNLLLLVIILVISSSCAYVNDVIKTTKGTLLGNSYTIYQYDNDGNPTLNIKGGNIDIEPYNAIVSESGEKEINSVLDITIDGKQILSVGNSLIFEEEGSAKIVSFEEIDEVVSKSVLNFIPFDKVVNSAKNKLGKQRMIIIYSQLGKPIGIYEGNSVYATIPEDLPKMTRLNIDGKSLYLHRVNYTIIDKNLID